MNDRPTCCVCEPPDTRSIFAASFVAEKIDLTTITWGVTRTPAGSRASAILSKLTHKRLRSMSNSQEPDPLLVLQARSVLGQLGIDTSKMTDSEVVDRVVGAANTLRDAARHIGISANDAAQNFLAVSRLMGANRHDRA